MAERLTPNGFKKPLGKLAFLNVPVGDTRKGKAFYEALIGTDFAQSLWEQEHVHAPASRGVQLHVSSPYYDGQTVIAQFAVANLKQSVSALKKLGGKVVQAEIDVQLDSQSRDILQKIWQQYYGCDPGSSMGKGVLMMDPWGTIVGLVQLEEWAERAFRFGHVSDEEFAIHNVAMASGVEYTKRKLRK